MKEITLESVFGEDEDLCEVLNLIRFDDFEDATNVKDELNYNSGWYNYSILTFDFKGNRYSIEYKEHTSDNVSDMEYLFDTFTCLGSVKEMEETITGEELAQIELNYKRQIEHLKKYKETLDVLRPLSKDILKDLGQSFSNVSDKKEERVADELKTIGEFFNQFADMK